MILDILGVDNPLLREHSREVVAFGKDLNRLAKDMRQTMRKHNGSGLAAPQVGHNIRLLMAETPPGPQQPARNLTLVNPRIVRFSVEETVAREGCLSMPDVSVLVRRPLTITVEALDLSGKPVRLPLWGHIARVVQHEIDHLNGILIIDYEVQAA